MVIAATALFGLAIGAILEYATAARHKVVPHLAVFVILAYVVTGLIINYPDEWLAGFAALIAAIIGRTLATGATWSQHPLLADMGYWRRTRYVFLHERMLRLTTHHEAEDVPAEAPTRDIRA